MRNTRRQIEAAVRNVEAALRELSDRLEDALPVGGRRHGSRIERAGSALRRTAHSMADRLPTEQGVSLLQDAGRTARAHPFTVALTAALGAYCAWSLMRFANERSASTKRRVSDFADPARRRTSDALQEGLDVRH